MTYGSDAALKVAVNRCYGGFGLSDAGYRLYAKLKGLVIYPENDEKFSFTTYYVVPPERRTPDPSREEWVALTTEQRKAIIAQQEREEIYDKRIPRDDPALIETIETLGDAANGMCAQLDVVEIPADVNWQIEEYDGREWVAEEHRTW